MNLHSAAPAGPDTLNPPLKAVLIGPVMPELIRDELLAEIFAATVAQFKTQTAMIGEGVRLTYQDVDAKALQIARGLLRNGIGPGKVVGLWFPRGTELLISQIAVAKTGAAWLPFDADAPLDRIKVCLDDAEAGLLLASDTYAAKAHDFGMNCAIHAPASLIEDADQREVDARALGATPAHPAYMIYTSGSTGTPKGIVISQSNICHYLRSANVIYGLNAQDVVFQGASVAFDLSMEEIWVPYLVGATLFVATPAMMGDADKLPEIMEKAGVTVLDTVPTLLSLLNRDIPSLRIIILGGEACPPTLANTWCRAGRSIFNSYGPTEATVVATIAEVRPGEAVTIGGPIPNYTCYVADDSLNLLDVGVEGELLIGGPGVAQGYLKRPELTAEKFVANPYNATGTDPILYRSGDAVAIDSTGNIAFRGRIDDQVKIRGFRVELGEIENKLTDFDAVAQAAVVLRHDEGMDQLVAFIVPKRSGPVGRNLDSKAMRSDLKGQLPGYMVPARFEMVDELPRLSSGKVNRNALKKAVLQTILVTEEQEEPQTPTEAILLSAAKKTLPPQAIAFDADFFTDLGGHSLIAARFISIVRETPQFAGLTLQDVYVSRNLRAMAAMLDKKFSHSGPPKDLSFVPPPLSRRFFCGLAQICSLPFLFALMNAQWLSVFVSFMLFTGTDASLLQETFSLLGIYIFVHFATVLVAVAGKWLILGRTRPGRYPLWGTYYFRWWFSQALLDLAHIGWLQGTPLMRYFLNSLGANIGADCMMAEMDAGAFDLISIGAGTATGGKLIFANARVEGNELIIGSISIGADCMIGSSCVIENDVVIGDHVEIRDITAIPTGSRIGAGEIWDGSPGRKVGMVDIAALDTPPVASRLVKGVQLFVYFVMTSIIPPLGLMPILPAFWLFDHLADWINLSPDDHTTYLLTLPILAWPTAFAMMIFTVSFITLLRWLILPAVREGKYSIYSHFYLRKWIVAFMSEITLDVLTSLYATVYMRAWYRLMGSKIGKGSEISTNFAGRYDLVEIGDKCFIADEVVMGDDDIRRGWMTLKRLRTGSQVFIGNSGLVPSGADIPDGVLIGIKSKPPANELMSPGDTWLGSPPMKLPVRQRFDGGGANWTYEPTLAKRILRALFEATRASMPTMLSITFGSWLVDLISQPLIDGDYMSVFGLYLLASFGMSTMLTIVVIIIKWTTMGRYEPCAKPMWSWWAMSTEAVAVLHFDLAGKSLLGHLQGTPFLPWVLRLYGVKTGKGIYMDSADITEFDCVSIGDFVSLNTGSALQTHLYEDRVMKVGRVSVARGVTVGSGATVLYDTVVSEYARLGPLTLVMKGESIPANSEWVGIPAEPREMSDVETMAFNGRDLRVAAS